MFFILTDRAQVTNTRQLNKTNAIGLLDRRGKRVKRPGIKIARKKRKNKKSNKTKKINVQFGRNNFLKDTIKNRGKKAKAKKKNESNR